MPSTLDPVILRKLESFGQRWRRLILLRGLCEGVVTLLGAMTLTALLDWLFILPDPVRWGLSGAGYLATGAVVWLNCVRLLLRTPGPREMARLMEKAEPQLREDLISAVELADSTPDAQYDSEIFRRLLQQNVASRVQDVQVSNLLPNKLISRWLYSASAVVIVCAALLLLPDLHYDQLMARAFAPLANVDRVSSVHITIVEPSPAELLVPRGDNVPVLVKVAGPEPSKVLLETFREGEKKEKDSVMMSLVGDRQYSATISAGTETVYYRVRAGDGITRKFAIRTRRRPHVVQFDKTFQYPAYARLEPRHMKEENGDLSALEGSSVDLRLQVDQAVKEGELRLEQAGRQTVIRLTPAGTNQLQGTIPVTKAGTYLVHLVAAETGFENKFSPQYEIRPVPDLVPRVSIDAPAKDLVISGDELIPLKGSAKDDLAVTNVTQMIRVNESPWMEVPLFTNAPQAEAVVARQWDLLSLKANPGDRVTTKLVAQDLKGHRGESAPLHLQIISPGFDAKRLRALVAKQQLNDSLVKLRESAGELKEALSKNEARNLNAGDDLHRKQSVLGATAAAEETGRRLDKAIDQLKQTLPQAAPGRDAADLALVGQMLSELKQETLEQARREIEKIGYEPNPAEPSASVKEATKTASRAADTANVIAQSFNDLFAADEAGAILANLNYLDQEQDRMNKQATAEANQSGTPGWERLARREGGATKETKVVEDMLGALAQHTDRSQGDRARKTQKELVSARQPMEQALTNSPPGRELLKPSANMQKGVANALANLAPLERDLSQRADRARDRLSKMAGPAHAKLAELRRDVEELARNESKLAESTQQGRKSSQLETKTAELKERTAAEWKAAVEQLKDRGAFEELRRDADSYFVADAAKTAQALSALRAASEGEQQAKQAIAPLKNLESAFRTLEAGHALAEVNTGLKQLANQERWEPKAMDTAVNRPKEWNWLGKQMQIAVPELQKAGLPKEAAQTVAEAARGPAVQGIKQEMDARQAAQLSPKSPRAPVPVPDELDALNGAVRQAQQLAQPAVDEARAAVARAAPTLSQMMAGLARASQEVRQATQDALPSRAQAAAQSSPPTPAQSNSPAQPPTNQPTARTTNALAATATSLPATASSAEPRKLLGKQQDLNQQVNDLKDALRRDANVQDITRADGRDRSRDADDAVAMLREPPVKAEDALREATTARQPANQERALSAAAQQQQKMADVLNQLARHYRELEAGRTPETRTALRQAEEELGIKSGLDSEYTKAETMASMMQKTPEEMLRDLEKELARNEVMRKELDHIADFTLEDAQKKLQHSATQEQNIGQRLNEAAQAQERQKSLAERVRQIAEQAKKMAKQTVPDIRMDASTSNSGAQPDLDQAAQALQSAAEKAPVDFSQPAMKLADQVAELAKPLHEASGSLVTAANKAAQALKQFPPADPKATAAHSAQTQAGKAAQQASEMKRQAQEIADQLAATARSSDAQMSEGAAQQRPIAQNLMDAATDISRAGRHESRLGTPQGMALQQVGSETQTVAEKQVPAAQQALSSQSPAQAAGAVASAREAMEKRLAELKGALQMAANKTASSGSQNTPPSNQGNQPTEGNPSSSQASSPSPGESKQMARTLDRIDAAMNAAATKSQQGQAGNDPNQAAANAMADAAQAQQAAMRSSRQGGNVPGEKPSSESQGTGNGAAMKADAIAAGALPELRQLNNAGWAKLPPKLAQGLMEAQREGMAGEYRAMVETYFRVIAEKAKENGP